MTINWPLIFFLIALCIPGIVIAIPRLIHFLLKDNSAELKKRISRFAVGQTLLMVFIMSLAGSLLSKSSPLDAPILSPLLKGDTIVFNIQDSLLPVFGITIVGLIIFLGLYYGVFTRFIAKPEQHIMRSLRRVLGLDGCMLYSGVSDEIIARWGLMNVTAFFGFLFTGHYSDAIIWTAIIVSGVLFALGQLPTYLAAGCKASRTFLYALVLLNVWQSIVFGFIFWHYGLLMAIMAHMIFHVGWWQYDKPNAQVKA
ncbi:CPBP family glutamic-type intramembrane protease [Legionella impletisoli]|uniref:Membrane protein n=1 Tax=Legionella impletisoli TaxID=343510 RepID=A0A917JVP2_9GAMM|nr:CPBP family glutamic-type intramembrane protease [Legionella impletisoli]GGI88539.1 membrane protein [Legionella impletisoli]